MRRTLLLLAALGGCASQHAQEDARALYGKTSAQIVASLGPAQKSAPGVLEWDYQAQPESSALPLGTIIESLVALPVALTGLSVTSGVAHSCRLIVTLTDDRVSAVRWAGDHRGLTGSGAWCEAIFPKDVK